MLTRTSARWPRVCAGGGYYVSILGSPRPRLRNSSSLNTGTTSPLLSPYAISAAAFPRLVPFFLGRTCYSTLSAPSSYHAHHHRSSSVSTNSSSAVYKSSRSCASAKSFSTSSTSTTSTATPSATHMASADTIRRRSGKDVAHDEHDHVHENGHNHSRDHDHSHSHSIFGGHTHSHDEGHDQNAEAVVKALKGSGDRGTQVTLVGLASNVGLTAVKGLAGWYMNSAALLAEAGHSFSDLMGDFVTLFCWKLSRRPPSEKYPYGFAKFETLGTTTVSLLLIAGALGIGFHSYQLLIHAIADAAASTPAGALHTILSNVTAAAPELPDALAHGHGHEHDMLDPNAAWFALASVLIKESLYRITKRVADEEHSPVLMANAVHHRSDAYSSLVALVAIGGSWWFPALPLDPIGGFLISVVILQQGLGLWIGSIGELTDAGVSSRTRKAMSDALQPLLAPSVTSPSLLAVTNLRARRAGSLAFVELTADVPSTLTVSETASLEHKIEHALKEARREVAEVRVQFRPVDK